MREVLDDFVMDFRGRQKKPPVLSSVIEDVVWYAKRPRAQHHPLDRTWPVPEEPEPEPETILIKRGRYSVPFHKITSGRYVKEELELKPMEVEDPLLGPDFVLVRVAAECRKPDNARHSGGMP